MRNNKLFHEIFRFCVTGFLAFIVDYLILILFKEVFNFEVLLSTIIAYVISTIINYILTVKWVFNIKGINSERKNFTLFLTFSLLGLLVTEIIMWYGCKILSINYLAVKIFAVGIVMIINYVTRKIFLK